MLLDNGRTKALADRVGRQALRCIRCGACLNVCPVYERVGGHAYGSVYPGPIGAVLTPQLDGVATDRVTASLPFASTLCGACYEVCPVRIDIPHLLVHLRARSVEHRQERGPSFEAVAMAAAGVMLASPRRLAIAERVGGRAARAVFRKGKIVRLPGPLGRWTAVRDAPLPARQPFRDWWRAEHPMDAAPAASSGARTRPYLSPTHVLRSLLPSSLRSKTSVSGGGNRTARARHRRAAEPAGSGRDAVLDAVRRALEAAPPERASVPRSYRGSGASGIAEPLELFAERLCEYRAEVIRVDASQVADAIADRLVVRHSGRVVVPADLPEAWIPAKEGLTVLADTASIGSHELDAVDAAVTGCAVAIADTGTIVLDGGPGQGRRVLSLVPDHLVVVVLAEQVVAGVPDGVARISPRRAQTWISGPSATSDIELDRVEGVHGPRRLDVILVERA